ncbi:MAG: hypothetical protein EBU33_08215 [Sphingobacteriia bacterium]|jgi:hypothetical protein|nr:hypothetical protein [Sphingobacteriia bacterium]
MAKTRRYQRKKRQSRKQRGGGVQTFEIYLFSDDMVPADEQAQLVACLQDIYGAIAVSDGSPVVEDWDAINEESDLSTPSVVRKRNISSFVHEKGGHYGGVSITGIFTVTTIPAELNRGTMNDAKLTTEEYKIRDAFRGLGLPFRLVDAQHGLWAEGQALIAIEYTG